MKTTLKMYAGFSTLEMIVTVALIAIALGFTFIFQQSSQVRSDLQTQTSLLVSQLRLAQSNAASGNSSGHTGIHLETTAYTLFRGASYAAENATNEVIDLPPSISLTNISLAGTAVDVIFTAPKGETAQYGSFRLTSSAQNQFNQITISSLGTITQ